MANVGGERFDLLVVGSGPAGEKAAASVSLEQGRVAACYAMGIPFKQTVDPLTPFGVYTIPECAMVGLTQQQAREAGIEHAVGVARFEDNSRAAIAGRVRACSSSS
jgi:NAD(P) transhydrogenase